VIVLIANTVLESKTRREPGGTGLGVVTTSNRGSLACRWGGMSPPFRMVETQRASANRSARGVSSASRHALLVTELSHRLVPILVWACL
jgi:hypothetical protein